MDSRLWALHRSDPEPSHKTSIVCLPESSSQLPLPKTPCPLGFSGFAAGICRAEVCVREADSYCRDAWTEKSKETGLSPLDGSLAPRMYAIQLWAEAGGRKSGQRHSLARSLSTASPSSLSLPCALNSHAVVCDQMPQLPMASGPLPCLRCPKGCPEVSSEHSRGGKAD